MVMRTGCFGGFWRPLFWLLWALFAPLRAADRDPRNSALPGEIPEAVKKAIAFDKAGKKADKPYRIGYLTECVTNTYCEARMKGLQDAADKYGFTFKIFDANFNPQAQVKHVQNAVQENFDGYLFAPTADAAGCKMWKDFLVPTKKPVVSLDLTMCGDVTYTPGLAGTVTMQSQPYFDFHVEHAFAEACKGRDVCKGVSLSGFAGSDLFARWEKAIDNGLKKYPNVKMVSRREAKFDPRIAQQITQDALQVHHDLAFVVSHYDDMTLGAVAAIKAAGLVPGQGCPDLHRRRWQAREEADRGRHLQRIDDRPSLRRSLLCRGRPDDGARRPAGERLYQRGGLAAHHRRSRHPHNHKGKRRVSSRRTGDPVGARSTMAEIGTTAIPVSLRGVSKFFPGVVALHGVDLDFLAGEVHGLVGENGAGKSTLIKIIAGAYRPDQGTLELFGRSIGDADPRAHQEAGVGVIYQERADRARPIRGG